MSLLLQTIVNGVLVGGLFITISLGFSLAFGVLDFVDFAVGEWVMLGAFLGVACSSWLHIDPIPMLPVVFVVFGLVGWLLAPLLYRVRNSKYARPALMALAFTFGVATFARGAMLTAVGFDPRTVNIGLVRGTVSMGSLHVPALRLAGFVFAAVATALFMIFLYRTRTGLAIRAIAQDKQNAGMTAMAGVLIGGIYSITAQDGPRYTLLAFFVVVLAGLGSVGGVLVAGLLLGVLQALVTVYVSANYTLAIVFAVLFLVLVVSPRGILRKGAL